MLVDDVRKMIMRESSCLFIEHRPYVNMIVIVVKTPHNVTHDAWMLDLPRFNLVKIGRRNRRINYSSNEMLDER